MKINVLIQETKIIACLCTDASHDTLCSRALNMQLPRIIAEGSIHHGPVTDGQSFCQNQLDFLLTC